MPGTSFAKELALCVSKDAAIGLLATGATALLCLFRRRVFGHGRSEDLLRRIAELEARLDAPVPDADIARIFAQVAALDVADASNAPDASNASVEKAKVATKELTTLPGLPNPLTGSTLDKTMTAEDCSSGGTKKRHGFAPYPEAFDVESLLCEETRVTARSHLVREAERKVQADRATKMLIEAADREAQLGNVTVKEVTADRSSDAKLYAVEASIIGYAKERAGE